MSVRAPTGWTPGEVLVAPAGEGQTPAMSESRTAEPTGQVSMRRWGAVMAVLTLVVLVFFVIRLVTDGPHILAGTTPDDDFAERYVAHPWVGYGHIVPGVVYLVLAPIQLSRRIRTRHYALHRRLGRVLLGCALLSGSLALVLGLFLAWGGAVESVASVVFGAWFLVSLVLAVRAVRGGRVAEHRRWMVRAFAVSLGIASIRIWVGIFTAVQVGLLGMGDGTFPVRDTFALAFWLGLGLHVLLGEWWLRRTPALDG